MYLHTVVHPPERRIAVSLNNNWAITCRACESDKCVRYGYTQLSLSTYKVNGRQNIIARYFPSNVMLFQHHYTSYNFFFFFFLMIAIYDMTRLHLHCIIDDRLFDERDIFSLINRLIHSSLFVSFHPVSSDQIRSTVRCTGRLDISIKSTMDIPVLPPPTPSLPLSLSLSQATWILVILIHLKNKVNDCRRSIDETWNLYGRTMQGGVSHLYRSSLSSFLSLSWWRE